MECQGRHAAGIDDALQPMAQRRLHYDLGSGPVVAQDLFRIARPEPVIGGDMKEMARPGHGPVEGGRIAEIALDDLEIEAGEIGARALRAHQGANPVARRDQRARHRRADEAACASNEGQILGWHGIRYGSVRLFVCLGRNRTKAGDMGMPARIASHQCGEARGSARGSARESQ